MSHKLYPSLTSLYRLQWEEVQKSYVLLFPEGMVKLGETAGEILEQCDGKNSVENIIKILLNKYEGSGIKENILDFFEEAFEHGWIKY